MSWWKFWGGSDDDSDDEYFNCSECGFLVSYDDSVDDVCYDCLDKKDGD